MNICKNCGTEYTDDELRIFQDGMSFLKAQCPKCNHGITFPIKPVKERRNKMKMEVLVTYETFDGETSEHRVTVEPETWGDFNTYVFSVANQGIHVTFETGIGFVIPPHKIYSVVYRPVED